VTRYIAVLFFIFAAATNSYGKSVTIDEYIAHSGPSKDLDTVWLDGAYNALVTANAQLVTLNQPQLFCQPDDASLSPANLTYIVDNFIKTRPAMLGHNHILSIILMLALKGAYPCR
jgi:hypothetical protein